MSAPDSTPMQPLGELDLDLLALCRQESWELAVRRRGLVPFVQLADYAMAMSLSLSSITPLELVDDQVTIACVVALALYDAACAAELADPDLVALDAALERVADDAPARRIAVLQPGCTAFDGGRLRPDDHQDLMDLMEPANTARWNRIRDQARTILREHARASREASAGVQGLLRSRLDLIRATQLRYQWYDNFPTLPPQIDPDEDDSDDYLAGDF